MSGWLKLTDVNGMPVWIAKSWVQMVQRPLPHEVAYGTVTMLVLSGSRMGICETMEEVMTLLGVNTITEPPLRPEPSKPFRMG